MKYLLMLLLISSSVYAGENSKNFCKISEWDGLYHLKFRDHAKNEFEQGFESEAACVKATDILRNRKFPNILCGCNSKFNPLWVFTTLSTFRVQLTCYRLDERGTVEHKAVVREFISYFAPKIESGARECAEYRTKMNL